MEEKWKNLKTWSILKVIGLKAICTAEQKEKGQNHNPWTRSSFQMIVAIPYHPNPLRKTSCARDSLGDAHNNAEKQSKEVTPAEGGGASLFTYILPSAEK